MSGRFGTPASIDASVVSLLPIAMQREAALMLLDMGLSPLAARRHLGWTAPGFDRLVNVPHAPFIRGGDLNTVAEEV